MSLRQTAEPNPSSTRHHHSIKLNFFLIQNICGKSIRSTCQEDYYMVIGFRLPKPLLRKLYFISSSSLQSLVERISASDFGDCKLYGSVPVSRTKMNNIQWDGCRHKIQCEDGSQMKNPQKICIVLIFLKLIMPGIILKWSYKWNQKFSESTKKISRTFKLNKSVLGNRWRTQLFWVVSWAWRISWCIAFVSVISNIIKESKRLFLLMSTIQKDKRKSIR